jgi:hypothetical protein
MLEGAEVLLGGGSRRGRATRAGHLPSGQWVLPDEMRDAMLVRDRLTMFVTDPVAELDDALADVARRRAIARRCGDALTAAALTGWLDQLLDERLTFRSDSRVESMPR